MSRRGALDGSTSNEAEQVEQTTTAPPHETQTMTDVLRQQEDRLYFQVAQAAVTDIWREAQEKRAKAKRAANQDAGNRSALYAALTSLWSR
jgi:hypothetical protein